MTRPGGGGQLGLSETTPVFRSFLSNLWFQSPDRGTVQSARRGPRTPPPPPTPSLASAAKLALFQTGAILSPR